MKHKIVWKGKRRPLADSNKVTMKIDDSDFEGNLPLYLEEVNHSPTGFEWGYYGSGPTQLSYAILRSYLVLGQKMSVPEAIEKAKNLAFRFKQDFVSKWHGDEWEVTGDQVAFWLETEKGGYKAGWV